MTALQLAEARMADQTRRQRGAGSLIDLHGVGVRFQAGKGREDLQSLAYRGFRRAKGSREVWALRDVELALSAGEIVGIIGRNGAGKTTLCRVLAGLLQPDQGSVARHCEVSALLALGTGFNAELSGEENAYLNGLMLGYSKRELERTLPEIAEFSGLGRFIKEPLKHYSSGMRARLGFSIASMLESELLVIDETLTVGDLEFRRRAGERLQELVSRARSVVAVTHQLGFVEEYCTRAVWLDQGQVRDDGRPADIVAAYKASLPKPAPVHVSFAETESHAGATQVANAEGIGVRFRLQQSNDRHQQEAAAGRQPAASHQQDFWALRDVQLSLHKGEIVGIIGPNGSGKTTLCRVLTGILRPDIGRVTVRGRVTALLVLGAGFNDQLSGKDNIYLNGMMLGMPKRRVREAYPQIVAFSELREAIDRPVKHLSAGMRSRLGFSILSSLEPDVFIIDEALGAGDAAFQEKASARLQALITDADAVIVVSHSMPFVERVCTRALWLDRGRVRKDGSPEEVVGAYRQSLQAG